MTPAEFRAQVHAAGPPQGHPFTPISEDYARPCVGSFADGDGTRECLVHGGRITAEAPFAGCDER